MTIVSLLFVLALGAITVGLNFNHLTDESIQSQYYDAVLPTKNAAVKRNLRNLKVKKEDSFTYKLQNHKIYVSGPEIDAHKLKTQLYHPNSDLFAEYQTVTLKASEIKKPHSLHKLIS